MYKLRKEKTKNQILSLKDQMGKRNWEENEIKRIVKKFYQNVYKEKGNSSTVERIL